MTNPQQPTQVLISMREVDRVLGILDKAVSDAFGFDTNHTTTGDMITLVAVLTLIQGKALGLLAPEDLPEDERKLIVSDVLASAVQVCKAYTEATTDDKDPIH